MKIITIILILILAGCSANDTQHKKMSKEKQAEGKVLKNSEKTEEEIVLGEAVTNILDKGENRVNNIEIACKKIYETKLEPEKVFSFNSATGERNTKNGYKNAPVIVNGEKSEGIGGGVCQVSTTIYLASLNANLSIIEQHNHSEKVAYAPDGKDATVVYGVKDLKIKNNTGKTIYIYTWIEDGKVFSKIIQKSIDIQ